jgi:TPR repeat protein
LFAEEQYERAHFIYLHELAPIGDKYAQYMLGFMYEHGVGVDANAIEASSWYRIAAERGKREFTDVRDAALGWLSAEEREAADSRYLELRGRYSDAAVMLRQVNSDYDRLMTVRTGTRIPGGGRSLTTITSDPQAREADLLAAERRLERGLEFLSTILDKPVHNVNYTELDIDALGRDVREYLADID